MPETITRNVESRLLFSDSSEVSTTNDGNSLVDPRESVINLSYYNSIGTILKGTMWLCVCGLVERCFIWIKCYLQRWKTLMASWLLVCSLVGKGATGARPKRDDQSWDFPEPIGLTVAPRQHGV